MSPEKKATIDAFGKAVARRINSVREARGITQSELADNTGISQSQLSKQMRGIRAINVDELVRIANSVGINVSGLLAEVERELSSPTDELSARRSNVRGLPSGSFDMPLGAVADSSPDEDWEGAEFDT